MRLSDQELDCDAAELQRDDGGELWKAAETVLWLRVFGLGEEAEDERFKSRLLALVEKRNAPPFRTGVHSALSEVAFRTRYPDVASQARGVFPVAVICDRRVLAVKQPPEVAR